MAVAQIVSGDGALFPATAKQDGETFAIDESWSVKAAIVSNDRTQIIVAAQDQSPSEEGADWANSLVVVRLTQASTANITLFGLAWLELQIDDGVNPKQTYFAQVNIVKGNVA